MEAAALQKLSDEGSVSTAVHVAQLSNVLLNRLREEIVYTSLGPVLISCNPGRVTASSRQALDGSAGTTKSTASPTTSKQHAASVKSWVNAGTSLANTYHGSPPKHADKGANSNIASAAVHGQTAAVPLFHASVMWQYFDGVQRRSAAGVRANLPPHIFGSIASAIRNAVNESTPQSLIFLGERGSGKTEAVRQVMRYAATVSRALKLRQAQIVGDLLKSAPGIYMPRQLSMPVSPEQRRAIYQGLLTQQALTEHLARQQKGNQPSPGKGQRLIASAVPGLSTPYATAAASPSMGGPGQQSALSSLAASGQALEQLLLDAHAVLEAFGSAGERASRSPASTRFLHWTSLAFARDGSLEGARVHAHLVDHWRVACPPHSVVVDRWKGGNGSGSNGGSGSSSGQALDGSSAQRYVSQMEHVRAVNAAAASSIYGSEQSGDRDRAGEAGVGGPPAAVDTNFRVFYLLLAGCSTGERSSLKLRDNPIEYSFLRAYGPTACPTLYVSRSRQNAPLGSARESAAGPFPGAAARYASGGGGGSETFPLPPAAAEYLKKSPWTSPPTGISLNGRRPRTESAEHSEGVGGSYSASSAYTAPISSAQVPPALSVTVLAEEWAGLQAALQRLQLGPSAQSALWRLLSAILLLGEVQFSAREVPAAPSASASAHHVTPAPAAAAAPAAARPVHMRTATVVANADVLWAAATLLGVAPERLATCLTTAPASMRGLAGPLSGPDSTAPCLPISPAKASLVRDVLACTLYRRLWSHLVVHINVVLTDASTVTRAARDESIGRLMASAQESLARLSLSRTGYAAEHRGGLAGLADTVGHEREYVSRVTRALAVLPVPSGSAPPLSSATGEGGHSPATVIVVDGPGLGGIVGDGLAGKSGMAGQSALIAAMERQGLGSSSHGGGRGSLEHLAANTGPVPVSSYAGPASFSHLLLGFAAEALEGLYQRHSFVQPAEQAIREGVPHPYLLSLTEGLRSAVDTMLLRTQASASALATTRSSTPSAPGPSGLTRASPPAPSSEVSGERDRDGDKPVLVRPRALSPMAHRGALAALLPAELSSRASTPAPAIGAPPVPPMLGPHSGLGQGQATMGGSLTLSVSPTSPITRQPSLPVLPFPDSRLFLSLMSRTPGTEEILRRLGTGGSMPGGSFGAAGALATTSYANGAASIPSLSTAELLGGRPDAHSKACLLTYLNEAAGYAFPDPSTGVLGPASAATAQSLHTAAHTTTGAQQGEEGHQLACTLPSHWRVRDGQLDADALGTWLGQVQASKPGMTPGVQTALRSLCTRLPAPEAAVLLGVKFHTSAAGSNGHTGTPVLTGANGSIIGAASSYASGGGMHGLSLGAGAGTGSGGYGLNAYLDGLNAGSAQPPTAPVLPSAQIQALASTTFALRHVHGWVAYAGEGMLLCNAACPGCEEASVLREGGRATGGLPDHLLRLLSTSSTDPLTSILMRGGSGGPAASAAGAADTIDPLTGELIMDPTATSGTPGAPPLGFQDVMRPHACAACAGCIVELTSSLLTVLSSTKPTFVRCIRPCDESTVGPSPLPGGQAPTALKGKDALSSPAVERQLRAMGALQLGLLSAYGLPVTIPADLFWERFVLLDGTCLRAAGPILPGWTAFNPADPGPVKPASLFSAMTPSRDSAFAARIRAGAGGGGKDGNSTGADSVGASGRMLSTLSRAALTRLVETLWARYYLPSEARAAAINTAPLLKADTPLHAAIPRMFRDVPVTAGLPTMQVGGSHLAEIPGFGHRSAGNAMVEAAYAIGRGSIFLSSAFYSCLESERDHHILRMDTSTIRLQTWARTMLCRLRFLYLKSCTVRIQSWWRAGCARRAFVQYKDAASTLKMFVLSKHRRAQFQRTISAAGVIQRAWRLHIMPKRIARLKYCVSALHELVRGYVIRARMEKVYRSAVRIQDAVRAWRERKSTRKQQQGAIVRVQAVYRSYRSRKHHPVETASLLSYRRDRRRVFVLTRFIARWRMRQVRAYYRALKATALLLQKWIRSRLTRFGFLRVRRSVVTLQARWRAVLARRLVGALRRSIAQAKEDRVLQALRVAEAMGLGLVGDGTAGLRLAPPVLGPALTAKQAAAFPPSTSTLRLIDVDLAVSGIKDVYHTGAGLLHPVSQQPGEQRVVHPSQGGFMGELRQGLGLPQAGGRGDEQDTPYAPPPTGTTPLFLSPISPTDPSIPVPFTSWSAVFRSLCVALGGRESTVASMAIGETHTLVADSHGKVYSWGWGDKGQLGHGSSAPSAVPRVLQSLCDPSHPSHPHSALSVDGTSTKAKATAAKAIQGKNPMLLGLGRIPIIITSVVVGRDHSVALSAAGLVYTWGRNGRGQLGLGHCEDVPLPTLVTDGPHKPVAHIAAGDAHTVLVTQMGAVYVCGAGQATGLGRLAGGKQGRVQTKAAEDKSLPDALLPTVLSSLTQTAVRAVACGRGHTIVLGAAGEVYGWGVNDCGQLAQAPAVVAIATSPIPLAAKAAGRANSPEPGTSGKRGGSKVQFAAIACGSKHTVLLSSGGQVWTTGCNSHGQLGTGDTKDKHGLIRVKLQASAANEEPTDEDTDATGPTMVSIAAAGCTSFGIVASCSGPFGSGKDGKDAATTGQLVRETKGSRLRQAASAGDRQASSSSSSFSSPSLLQGERTVHVWGKAGVVTEAKLRMLLLKAIASASPVTAAAAKQAQTVAAMSAQDVAAMVVHAVHFASGDAASATSSSAAALAGLRRDEVAAIARVLHVTLATEQGLLLPTELDEAQLPVGSSSVCLLVPTPVPRAATLAGAGGSAPPVPVAVSASGHTAMAAAWVRTVQPPSVPQARPSGQVSSRKVQPQGLAPAAQTPREGSLPVGLQGQDSDKRTSLASSGLPLPRVQGQGSIVGRTISRA